MPDNGDGVTIHIVVGGRLVVGFKVNPFVAIGALPEWQRFHADGITAGVEYELAVVIYAAHVIVAAIADGIVGLGALKFSIEIVYTIDQAHAVLFGDDVPAIG